MQRIPVPIPAAQLTTSAAPYYTAATGTTATINNLSLTNTTTGVVSFTLHRVPSGGTASAANMIGNTVELPGRATAVPPQAIGLQLSPGMTLQALASAAASITIAGGAYETSGS
ncbi:hypothetical protein CEY09_30500 [Achromobacter marplatensis]|uniref:Uncharacterized protein n=1 Tax=Achromobacter marplatensis TaxID=470868 RepID=A0ABX9FYR7_9BURK|nr:hypothetical protein [Achromobacter marplatensis]OWT55321.1 hypothetical protein CEY09_30500 [Achromobacter marplatensis]RBP10663.1 hypothetical protein DFP87_12526 [Achromobacter marplatensis]CAB3713180.1 hypothetical protein LMG26219_06047 [Achromobacter marplatensis]